MTVSSTKRLILISQVYPPDPTAVGQHFADLTNELAARGWHVLVLSSNRGYDNPAIRFSAYEEANGVAIKRLPFSSFGKGSIPIRLAGQLFFSLQALAHCLTARRYHVVISSTSPPFAGFIGAILSKCRVTKLLWWVMDINPDQIVAAKKLRRRFALPQHSKTRSFFPVPCLGIHPTFRMP